MPTSPEYLLLIAALIFLVFALLRSSGEENDRSQKPSHDEVAEDLVTIASFHNPGVAHVAKGKLESEGIDGYLANDFLSTVDFPQVLIDGGVHLRVRESDVPKARKLLFDDNAEKTELLSCDQCGTIVQDSDKFCPGCGDEFTD